MKNSNRSFKLAHSLGIALLVGLLPGSAQAVVPVRGQALTVVGMNDKGDQTDPHVSGEWVPSTDNSVYRIRFQNLDPTSPAVRTPTSAPSSNLSTLI